MDKNLYPVPDNNKKTWFGLFWNWPAKEKVKCELCGIEIPEGHRFCNAHWKEKFDDQRQLESTDYIKK